jgi:hypothetical protein
VHRVLEPIAGEWDGQTTKIERGERASPTMAVVWKFAFSAFPASLSTDGIDFPGSLGVEADSCTTV